MTFGRLLGWGGATALTILCGVLFVPSIFAATAIVTLLERASGLQGVIWWTVAALPLGLLAGFGLAWGAMLVRSGWMLGGGAVFVITHVGAASAGLALLIG